FEHMRLKPASRVPGLKRSLGEELLRIHRNYQQPLARIPAGMIRVLAHITGGGLIDNLPRVLPRDCDALIETKKWRVPAIFEFLQCEGKVDRLEMYQVFNMGIGMAAIVSANDWEKAALILKAKSIGRIVMGSGKTRLIFDKPSPK